MRFLREFPIHRTGRTTGLFKLSDVNQRSEQREKPLRGKPPLRLLSKKAPYHNAFPRDCHLNLVQMLECPVCACRRRGVVAPFYGGVISDYIIIYSKFTINKAD